MRDWFAGRIHAAKVDGTRSVHLPHPDGCGRVLKLKGAGFAGGPIQFGVYHNTGPKAAQFDFDGRMMDDVASGWDGAFEGGASFQQAVTEYNMAQRLTALGYAVIPASAMAARSRAASRHGLRCSIMSPACASIPTCCIQASASTSGSI